MQTRRRTSDAQETTQLQSSQLDLGSSDDNPFLRDSIASAVTSNRPGADDSAPPSPCIAAAAPVQSAFDADPLPSLDAAPAPLMSPEQEERFLRISVLTLAGAMFFNFGMYAPVQNVVTTVFPSSGTISLVLIYSTFCSSTIFTPSLVRWLGAPSGVVLGCLGYLCYTLGCLCGNLPAFLVSSALVGLCAGIIWTSQGAVLTMLSTSSNRGVHSALVMGGCRLAPVCSNILLGFLLNSHESSDGSTTTTTTTPKYSNASIFLVFLVLGCIALVLFCVLRVRMRTVLLILARRELVAKQVVEQLERERAEEEAQAQALADAAQAALDIQREAAASPAHAITDALNPPPPPPSSHTLRVHSSTAIAASAPVLIAHTPSLLDRLVEIFRVMFSADCRYLVPILIVVQGFARCFFFGTFGVTMGKSFLGYAQAVMGCVAVPTILGLGKLLDRIEPAHTIRKKHLIYVTLSLHMCFVLLVTATTFCSDGFTSRLPEADYPRTVSSATFSLMVYSSCVIFGAAWSGTDICCIYLIGQLFAQKQSETAFAAKSFSDSLGFVLSAGISALLPHKLYPLSAALCILPVMAWYSRWPFPVELLHSKKNAAASLRAERDNDVTGDSSIGVVWHH